MFEGVPERRKRALDRLIGLALVGGSRLAVDARMYSCVVAMPDGRWAVHRKLHVFVSEFLSPGDRYTAFAP